MALDSKGSLVQKYPKLEKYIDEVFSRQKDIKKLRVYKQPKSPTGNEKEDVPHLFSHFLNIIHMRLIYIKALL